MDVKRKVQLMRVYVSYWNMLPPELQAFIMDLKIVLLYPDEVRDYQRRRLLREIKQYINVKEKWALGHIRCVPNNCTCLMCGFRHIRVVGHYTNREGVKKHVLLGHSFFHASHVMNEIKEGLL